MSTTTNVILTSGSYAKSGTGNFTAYDLKGTQHFISANTMIAAGIPKDVMPVFPLFGFASTTSFTPYIPGTKDPMLDDAGNPVIATRLGCSAVFIDEVAFERVANAEFSLATRLQAGRESIVLSSGLSEASISMLLGASI